MQIAQTIREQLGNKLAVMVGAKNFGATNNRLQFHFMKAPKNKANICRVTLETDDTYMVEFWNLRGMVCKSAGPVIRGVYFDQLREVFANETGLAVTL